MAQPLELIEGLRTTYGWDDSVLLAVVLGYAEQHEAFWAAPREAAALPPSFEDFVKATADSFLAIVGQKEAAPTAVPGTPGPAPAPLPAATQSPAPAPATLPATPSPNRLCVQMLMSPATYRTALDSLAVERANGPGTLGNMFFRARSMPFDDGLVAELRFRRGEKQAFIEPVLFGQVHTAEGVRKVDYCTLPPLFGEFAGQHVFHHAGVDYVFDIVIEN